jgi:hypothetical protein
MAQQKQIADFGAPAANGNGWRARIQIDGRKVDGPQRATRVEAEVDLDRARQCASRDEMSKFLISLAQELRKNSGVEQPVAHPAVAPGVGAEHGPAGDSGVEQPEETEPQVPDPEIDVGMARAVDRVPRVSDFALPLTASFLLGTTAYRVFHPEHYRVPRLFNWS